MYLLAGLLVIIRVHYIHISKLYTDNMCRFPIKSHSSNQYIILAYHCDGNLILVKLFQLCSDVHCIDAYNRIMVHLQAQGHCFDLQILGNEASAA